jgi:hypothetical protein
LKKHPFRIIFDTKEKLEEFINNPEHNVQETGTFETQFFALITHPKIKCKCQACNSDPIKN